MIEVLNSFWAPKPWGFWNLLGISIWDLGLRTSTDEQTGSRFQDLDIRTYEDLSFKTSTDRQRSEFQDFDRRTDGICVSGPRQMDRRDLGFKTSTNGQTRSEFQDLDRRTNEIWVSRPRQTNRRDLGFRTSTDGQTRSEFQNLDRQTHRLTELIYTMCH